MKHGNVSKAALTTLSVLLLGCASGREVNHVNALAQPLLASAPANVASMVKQAQLQRLSGDFAGATHALSEAMLLAPDDARVLGEYGKTLVAQGRSDDALAFLERASGLDPSDWSLFSAIGVAYDQKGNYPQAQSAYDRALAMKPGDATVLSNEALSHMHAGDLDEAERLLLQAEAHAAEFPRIASNLAMLRSLKASRPASSQRVAALPPPLPEAAPTPPEPLESIAAALATIEIPSESLAVATEPAEDQPAPMTSALNGIEKLRHDPSVLVQPLPPKEVAPVRSKSAAPRRPAVKAIAELRTDPETRASAQGPASQRVSR
jgi:Flp pilus assembly protein TadD